MSPSMRPQRHVRFSFALFSVCALAAGVCTSGNQESPRQDVSRAGSADLASTAFAEKGHEHEGKPGGTAAGTAGVNPVQNGMRTLHEATREWVTAIANNRLELIPGTIGKVHDARMLTEKAVDAGQYRPPKNGDAMADFGKQDEAFHAELVKLLQASKARDLPGTTRQLGVVLDGCTSCHLRFRF